MADCVPDGVELGGRGFEEVVTRTYAEASTLLLLGLLERGYVLLLLMLEDPIVFVDHLIDRVFAFRIIGASTLLPIQSSLRLDILDLPILHYLRILPQLCIAYTFIVI